MKAYKGFDKDLKCNGFQYEVGKEFKTDKAELCKCGFHACESPLDVFSYYNPAFSRFAEVELDGVSDKKDDDSKRVGTQIKIVSEIGIHGLIQAAVKFVFDRADWKDACESNKKAKGAASNSGYHGAASNSGYQGAASNSGIKGAASNSGIKGAASNSGDEGIAMSVGIESKAKASLGTWIVLSEWYQYKDSKWRRKSVKTAKVDGKKIKADTFYMLKSGRFIESE